MMRYSTRALAALVAATLAAACSDDDDYGATGPTPSSSGVSAEDKALEAAGGTQLTQAGTTKIVRATGSITAAVAQYRALLGDLNANVPGQRPNGRREVNWDGVPANFTNTEFPGDFFNANSPRGVLFFNVGGGLRVSNNGFTDVNPAYAGAFNTFSPARTFSPTGVPFTEVRFVVAGASTAARVSGFGSVFAGASRSGSARMEFYDASGALIRTVTVPRATDGTGLSFAGATFDAPVVAKVRIFCGEAAIGATTADVAAGGTADLVVMDDFIYAEPQAVQ